MTPTGLASVSRTSLPLNSSTAAFAGIAVAVLYAVVFAIFKWLPRHDCLALAFALWAMFRLFDQAAPRARTVALHAATQILAAAYVVHLLTLGYEGRSAVFGGILPWSDSFDYYNDALRLMYGDRLEFASKRPIFAAFLSALLRLSDGNLPLVLFALAMIGAWAIALATSEVWKTHGWRAALVIYFILLLNGRNFSGFIQTEDVGLPLGLIGFALIWNANAGRKACPTTAQKNVLFGLFAITVGLMARAGPFFVLPALAIWGARRLVPTQLGAIGRLRFLGVAALAVLAGVAVHETIVELAASGTTFSDYPAIAYGLIHGKDFTFLTETHPYLQKLAGSSRVRESWGIVLHDAADHPRLLIEGFAKSLSGLFASPQGLFSYVWNNPDDHILENGANLRASFAAYGIAGPLLLWIRSEGLYSLLNAGAMGLLAAAFVIATIFAIIQLYRHRSNPDASLLRHVIAGVLLSAPFTPPWITASPQVQTVVLAFVAALPATVLLRRNLARHAESGHAVARQPRNVEPDGDTTRLDTASGPRPAAADAVFSHLIFAPVAFVIALVLATIWMRLAPLALPGCKLSTGQVFHLYPSTIVEVAPSREFSFRTKSIADLFYSIEFLKRHNQAFTDSLTPFLKVGTVYIAGFDACDHRAKILIDDSHALSLSNTGWQNVLGRPLARPNIIHAMAVLP